LAELVSNSDVISLHVPLTPETAGLVDAEFLSRVRPGAVLVNTSRGGVVDESSVVEALDSGRLSAAGLDVHAREPASADNALVRHPRVLALPHIGSATTVTRQKMATDAVRAALSALGE
jgi:phosphoglycerate dehydrogenase-like enzyme